MHGAAPVRPRRGYFAFARHFFSGMFRRPLGTLLVLGGLFLFLPHAFFEDPRIRGGILGGLFLVSAGFWAIQVFLIGRVSLRSERVYRVMGRTLWSSVVLIVLFPLTAYILGISPEIRGVRYAVWGGLERAYRYAQSWVEDSQKAETRKAGRKKSASETRPAERKSASAERPAPPKEPHKATEEDLYPHMEALEKAIDRQDIQAAVKAWNRAAKIYGQLEFVCGATQRNWDYLDSCMWLLTGKYNNFRRMNCRVLDWESSGGSNCHVYLSLHAGSTRNYSCVSGPWTVHYSRAQGRIVPGNYPRLVGRDVEVVYDFYNPSYGVSRPGNVKVWAIYVD